MRGVKYLRKWLIALRKAKNMTQEQLANKCGISRTMITHIENGNSTPSVETAQAIANVLGFNWIRFFEPDQEAS